MTAIILRDKPEIQCHKQTRQRRLNVLPRSNQFRMRVRMADALLTPQIASCNQEDWGESVCVIFSNGEHTVIDSDCYEDFIRLKWKVHSTGPSHGKRKVVMRMTKKKTTYYSRYITNCPKGMVVDHRNHNTLDNRRSNLRVCTYQGNNANTRKLRPATSKYKGVSWSMQKKKWVVMTGPTKGPCRYIGSFHCEIEAAKAYNSAVVRHFGEFAVLNQIGD